MTSRERTFAIAFGGVAAVLAGRYLVMDVILGPINERKTRLERAEEDFGNKQFELTNQQAAAESLKKWKAMGLHADHANGGGNSSLLYNAFLNDLATKAGIKKPNTTVLTPRPVRDGAYTILPFTLSAQCDLAQLTKLLYEFQNTDILHSIKTLSIQPQANQTTDRIDHLNVRLDIDVLAFPDSPPRAKLELGGKKSDRKVEDFKFLAEKNFFQPTQLLPRDQAVAATKKDDRANVKFNGLMSADGAINYLFTYATGSEKPQYPAKGEMLDIPGMKARVLGYDGETQEVLLEVDGKTGGVRKGHALSTWKERPNPAAVMKLASQPPL